MNTRSYPRNSTLAFPKSCDYACAIERPEALGHRVVFRLSCVVLVVLVVLVLLGVL